MNKNETMSMMSNSTDQNLNFSYSINDSVGNTTAWEYWTGQYYPYVIKESYPVYIQERAVNSGKKAFEIIKIMQDKKLVKIEKVKDFITLMDELIKIL